ncbi:MAG: hypothetical protein R3F60_17230 [bacterium]
MLPLLTSLVALLAPVADAEVAAGAAVCGARGRVDCAAAGTGLDLELRADWRPWRWLGLGLAGLYATLPADGVDAGTLWMVGPEVTGFAEVAPGLSLLAAAAVGYNRIAGTRSRESALGAVGLRLGAATPSRPASPWASTTACCGHASTTPARRGAAPRSM